MGTVTVLYDEDCGICRWSADRLRRWDRRARLAFVPIQRAGDLLAAVPPDRRLEAMHAVTSDGRVWTGGAALPVIVHTLPGGAPLAAIAAAAPALTERLYRAAANRRETLARFLGQQACAVDPSRSLDDPAHAR